MLKKIGSILIFICMKYITIFLIAFSLIGCNQLFNRKKFYSTKRFPGSQAILDDLKNIAIVPSNSDSIIEIKVPGDVETKGIEINDLIDEVKFVKLETNKNSLIGEIDKLIFHNDTIIVIEKIKRQAILVFTNEGQFINKIGKKGKGPGELLSIHDVAIDNNKNNIIVIDDRSHKLVYYNLKGELVKEKKIPYFINNLVVLNDGSLLFKQNVDLNLHLSTVSDYGLIFPNESLEINQLSIPLTYRKNFPKNKLVSNVNFNISDSTVLYNPLFTDTLFEISSKNLIKAKYHLNMENDNITSVFNAETKTTDVSDIINTNEYYYFDGMALENANYLYFHMKGKAGDFYYSKSQKELYYGSFWKGYNERISYVRPITTFRNFFVAIMQPQAIINKNIINSAVDGSAEFMDISIDDNPVIVFYSFR